MINLISFNQTGNMAENTLSDEILDDKPTPDELTTHARTADWNELGIKLGLDSVNLGGCRGYAKMYQSWLQEKGDGATRRVLIIALRAKLLNSVADDYVKYLKTLVSLHMLNHVFKSYIYIYDIISYMQLKTNWHIILSMHPCKYISWSSLLCPVLAMNSFFSNQV